MTIGSSLKKVFAVSNLATVIACFYTFTSMRSIFKLMNPLHGVDIDSYPADKLIKPYWDTTTSMNKGSGGSDSGSDGFGMKIYLSTSSEFHMDFMVDEYRHKQTQRQKLDGGGGDEELLPRKKKKHDTILLWEEPSISSSSLARSFILTSNTDNIMKDNNDDSKSKSFQMASKYLEDAETKAMEDAEGGLQAVLSTATAGEGIASTSVLLTLYTTIANTITNAFNGAANDSKDDHKAPVTDHASTSSSRIVLPISRKSSIWSRLMNNSTAHIHVVLQRHKSPATTTATDTFHTAHQTLSQSSQSHNLLFGHVDLVKYSPAYHVPKPCRHLYLDASYLLRRYILHTQSSKLESKPWDMASNKASSEEYEVHRVMTEAKNRGEGYPYWKPEVAIKLVRDVDVYPIGYVHSSGMEVIHLGDQGGPGTPFHSGMAYLPGLHVDEFGLTSEKYIPVNATLDSLPLRISFDSHDGGTNTDDSTPSTESATGGGGLTPGRWRLLTHLTSSLSTQTELGFQESDIDDVRRLVADTNVTLLGITVLASMLHLLFEFLTFKTEVEFWNGNTDLTGLSVRALFMDFVSQVVILLFLVSEETSLLMTIPAAFGCSIALWKCQRGAGFRLVKVGKMEDEGEERPAIWNNVLRLVGYELQATRLRAAQRKRRLRNGAAEKNKDGTNATATNNGSLDLAALSEEMDHLATRTLGLYLLLPLVLSYTGHTLLNERHSGWYSWFITSASSAVYALGFVLMTPQLFLNYKLKSVAHLPWKVLGYRFVNTFIDDLFAFIIRMPTMARISCFRDDVVFLIYLWQRHLYPVDKNRPVEGGGMDAVSAAATNAVVNVGKEAVNVNGGVGDGLDKKNKKKKKKQL